MDIRQHLTRSSGKARSSWRDAPASWLATIDQVPTKHRPGTATSGEQCQCTKQLQGFGDTQLALAGGSISCRAGLQSAMAVSLCPGSTLGAEPPQLPRCCLRLVMLAAAALRHRMPVVSIRLTLCSTAATKASSRTDLLSVSTYCEVVQCLVHLQMRVPPRTARHPHCLWAGWRLVVLNTCYAFDRRFDEHLRPRITPRAAWRQLGRLVTAQMLPDQMHFSFQPRAMRGPCRERFDGECLRTAKWLC